ncbi:MAG: hypothetical protein QM737_08025 [Ferruginibacter sp.]
MITIGFSTGSLAKGDFKHALNMLKSHPNSHAIELSALRELELPLLVDSIPKLDLKQYKYISVHAPSKLINFSEDILINLLQKITSLKIPIIVHPDIIIDFEKWLQFGEFLCIENMDKRKSIGRTAEDLLKLFARLPEATFCLDLAHAKQIDPTMIEAAKMLRLFSRRLRQFHISDVISDSTHVPINIEAILAFRKIEKLIPRSIPFIIESPVSESYINHEFDFVRSIFNVSNHYSHYNNPFISNS